MCVFLFSSYFYCLCVVVSVYWKYILGNVPLSDSNSDVRIGKNPVQTVAIKLKQTTGTR